MASTLVLPQSFPLGLAIPSSLRVLVMSVDPFACLGKVEDVLDDAGGIRVGLQGGAFLRPVGHHDPVVTEGGVAGNPEAARGGLPHPPRDLLGEDISYPIDTKSSGSHGQKDLEPVNYGGPFRRPCVERAFLSGLVPSQHSFI